VANSPRYSTFRSPMTPLESWLSSVSGTAESNLPESLTPLCQNLASSLTPLSQNSAVSMTPLSQNSAVSQCRHCWVSADTLSQRRHRWISADTAEPAQTPLSLRRHLWVNWQSCKGSQLRIRISRRIRSYSRCKTTLECETVAQGKIYNEKKQRSKISWDCPFKKRLKVHRWIQEWFIPEWNKDMYAFMWGKCIDACFQNNMLTLVKRPPTLGCFRALWIPLPLRGKPGGPHLSPHMQVPVTAAGSRQITNPWVDTIYLSKNFASRRVSGLAGAPTQRRK
jgi:hypothetical protein